MSLKVVSVDTGTERNFGFLQEEFNKTHSHRNPKVVNEPSIARNAKESIAHTKDIYENHYLPTCYPMQLSSSEHTSDFKWQSQSKDALQPICAKTVILKYALIW